MGSMKPLVVLDLNGTLCHTEYNGRHGDYHVQRKAVTERPFLHTFLDHVFANYEVAVWTCNSERYANELVRKLFGRRAAGVRFVWNQTHCTRISDDTEPWIKDLSKIKHGGPVILVDDNKIKGRLQPDNTVCALTYNGDGEDTHLLHLIEEIHKRALEL